MTYPPPEPGYSPQVDPWASADTPQPTPPAAPRQTLRARSLSGTMVYDGVTVTVLREGRVARAAGPELHLNVASIVAVHWQAAGFSLGHITVTMDTGETHKVPFGVREQPQFEALYAAVHAALQRRGPIPYQPAPQQPPAPAETAFDTYLRQAARSDRVWDRYMKLSVWLTVGPLILAALLCLAGVIYAVAG